MEIKTLVGFRLPLLPVLAILAVASADPEVKKLREVYSWKALEFAFPSPEARLAAVIAGEFIPGAPVPIDVDLYSGGSSLIINFFFF